MAGLEMEASVTGTGTLSADLSKAAEDLDRLIHAVVKKSAADLCAKVKINASLPKEGPPGPRVITGDYMASWRVDHVFSGSDFFTYAVGTDRAQANRLEYGFTGVDSLGRSYDQPPYPHMGPAVDEIDPNFQEAMKKVSEAALKW